MNRLFVQKTPHQSSEVAATGQITFHANGGTGSMDPLTNLSEGDEFKLPRNTFQRIGFRFVGWTNMEGGNDPFYQDEYPTFNYYSYNSDLYAVWEPEASALKLSFDANGGEGTMNPIYVRNGQVILVPPHQFIAPEEGYECKGYGNAPDDYARYRIGGTASFTQSCVLYAFWAPLNGSIGGASEKFKGQTVFFDGVNIAPEDWVTIDKDSLYTYAEWHEGCGWYDTYKVGSTSAGQELPPTSFIGGSTATRSMSTAIGRITMSPSLAMPGKGYQMSFTSLWQNGLKTKAVTQVSVSTGLSME